jgi:hypothetical protein
MNKKIYSLPFICYLFCIGGCKEVFERVLDKDKIVLLAPGNNVISVNADQTFSWQPVDEATYYELQIVTPRFDSIVSFIADTTIRQNFMALTLDTTRYQWRVRAFNASSSTTFSNPWSVTIH